jgi:hypothetical protein
MPLQQLSPLLLMTNSKLFAPVTECFFSLYPYCFLYSTVHLTLFLLFRDHILDSSWDIYLPMLFDEVTANFTGGAPC